MIDNAPNLASRINTGDSKQLVIIFCASYHEITLALSVANSHPLSSIYFISHDPTILSEIAKRSISKCSVLVVPQLVFSRGVILGSFFNILLAKRYIYRLFVDVNNAIIYFFVVSWGYEVLWALQCISSKNIIYYIPSAKLLDTRNLRKSWIKSTLLSMLYAMRCPSIYKYGLGYRPIVDSTFLDIIKAIKIDKPTANIKLISKPKRLKGLLLYSMRAEIGQLYFKHYHELVLEILQSFSSYFDIKQHPRDPMHLCPADSLKATILPKNQAASTYVQEYSLVVGYASSLLVEASHYPQRTLISLVHALSADNEATCRMYLQANQGLASKILFPKAKDLLVLIQQSLNITR